jgi:hypothetical protein
MLDGMAPGHTTALARVAEAQAEVAAAEERLTAAILDAVRGGLPLRAIGGASGRSHEAVRALANRALAVTLVLPDGARIPLAHWTARGLGRSIAAFAVDPRAAEGDGRWARASAALARSLELAPEKRAGKDVALDRDATFALQQVLLLIYRGRPAAVEALTMAVARALA